MGFSLFGSSGSKSSSATNTTTTTNQTDNRAVFGDNGKQATNGATMVADGAINAGGAVSVIDGGAFAMVENITKAALQQNANASDRLAQSYATAQPATQTGKTYALALGVVALLAGVMMFRSR